MNKRRHRLFRRKKFKIAKPLIFLVLYFAFFGMSVYFLLFRGSSNKANVVEEISKYNYTLDDRDTVLMRSVFRDLKSVLKEKNIDFKRYAEDLCKLYVIDLYTINNKTSKYDIGGFEYVHPDGKENFKLQVGDTIYKYIGSKSLPKKELPEVSDVVVSDIKEDKYTYNDKEYDAYTMNVKWEYKKDLGYDDHASVVIMKDNDFLYIVEFNPEAN